MAKLRVNDLGRDGISISLVIPDENMKNRELVEAEILHDVKRHLISKDVTVSFDVEKGRGVILSGMHCVGWIITER
jgi:hypothetical protein